MSEFDFDLFVIGGGSGGVRAARIAAGHGARVAIAEEYRYGGTCVIRGCVPKKLLVFGSHFGEEFEDAVAYGWTVGEARFDWPTLIANKDKEIDRLNRIYIRMLKDAGCHVLDGRAVLADAHTVEVGGRRHTAATILIATGGYPFVPDFPGMEHAITSNEAFHLPTMPKRVAIVGGGFIAVEFAGIFNGLGAETVLLYRGEQILRGFDREARDVVAREIVKKGIDLRCGTDVARIESQPGDTCRVTLTDGSILLADKVMYATGRRPNTDNLGLESAGVAVDSSGAVKVDQWSRSSVPHIYAVGDVTDRINLTPVALQEGHRFADAVFGARKRAVDHANVPSA
ncbi:MAG: FAD-dependent oxidoreductase, partial [Alphaproteobacteria bacterium]